MRGLVFGGGGLVGLAWGIGWLDGLSKAELSLADADLVVGTSAGAALTAMVDATDRSRVAQALQLVPALGPGAGEPPAGTSRGRSAQRASRRARATRPRRSSPPPAPPGRSPAPCRAPRRAWPSTARSPQAAPPRPA
ncbi:MAG: patatin-like phospholipase family protein, partial [Actinomycetota bacterium]